jgi:hypothetical protein
MDWQVNYHDGNGWQEIEQDIVADEILALVNHITATAQIDYDREGCITRITTPFATYRRRQTKDAPLETHDKVTIDADGEPWAI